MATLTVKLPVDATAWKEARAQLAAPGVAPSCAVGALLRRPTRDGALPFSPRLTDQERLEVPSRASEGATR